MSWEKFCELHTEEIAPRYRRASKDHLVIADDSRGTFKAKIERLVAHPRSLLLMGPSGRGKTHFMMAFMRALFDAGRTRIGSCQFYRATTLDSRLVVELDKWKTVEPFIKQLSEPDFLFIDDFGIDRDTARAERDYYDLIDRRMAHERITVFSTNFDERSLTRIFGERIASRLKECAVIEFHGPDLREGIRL